MRGSALLLLLATAGIASAALPRVALETPPAGALTAAPLSISASAPAILGMAFSPIMAAPLVMQNSPPGAPAAAAEPANAPGAIALIQYDGDAHFGDYEHNLRNLTTLAADAAGKGAKIIVMPEGALYGYASKDELWCKPGLTEFKGRRCRDVSTIAESVPGGKSVEYWSEFSRKHGVFVLFNLPERDGSSFYNTMGVTGPSGFVDRYRKRMLYTTDKAYATAGTEPTVLKTEYGCFGLLICLDADPSSPSFEEYKALKADALIIAMDWDDDPSGQYAAKLKFREWALLHSIDIYASDSAPWDGTAKYPATGGERQRDGLPPDAVGVHGISHHSLKY
ncbi:MAG: carbon-nitrogen hydrolase family protein [Elusimicrobiota bacterium]